jgi:hypothetical protein
MFMGMMFYRLVHLIETHSRELADGLLARVRHSDVTPDYVNVPDEELRGRVYEIYTHLGEWLMTKDELGLETRYSEIGARRAAQRVPLSQLVWAIILTKKNLWNCVKKESLLERPVEVLGELELLQLLEEFFDRAIYHAVAGYERAVASHPIASTTAVSAVR